MRDPDLAVLYGPDSPAHGPPLDAPVTSALARFVADLAPGDLPVEVLDHIKLCLLDTLGCALFGSTLEWSRILVGTLARLDPDRSTSVWGTPTGLGPAHAALANGAAAHGFELDDLHKEAILHPGSVVTPAAVAAAGVGGATSGPRLLTGLVAGYEVGARVGMAVGAAHLLAGWHPTGTHGTLAAAAAASSILGLDAGAAQHALGIAGSQSAGLMASQFSSMVKRFHAGRAAQSGLYAACLAADGYTGITNLLESEYGGYLGTFSPTHQLDGIAEGLGSRWEMLRVGFKPYSTNGSCHPTIDLLKNLLATEDFDVGDVDTVRIWASSATVAHVGWEYRPDSVTTAQMNLPYICAVVLSDGDAFVDQFSAERIVDPALVALSRRVVVAADPEIDAAGGSQRHATRLEIRLRDGRVLTGQASSARGSDSSPLSGDEVRAKYRTLAAKAVPPEHAARLERLVDRLELADDVGELIAALAAPERSRPAGDSRFPAAGARGLPGQGP
jgi:aconitate decarboxylase